MHKSRESAFSPTFHTRVLAAERHHRRIRLVHEELPVRQSSVMATVEIKRT
ncbi:hypothetical protein [Rhodopirellula halodulae]|uniref:hypothetical protein n=1 Tax=Rhodopirellula halodulae TaxID=2894198 RepID=UPI001E4BA7D3|nr:hypothetical protein [Rhodopirellula sp. JC737]MCC9655564.1 hypothetical protein [Rhodopirellula sp. JC737]